MTWSFYACKNFTVSVLKTVLINQRKSSSLCDGRYSFASLSGLGFLYLLENYSKGWTRDYGYLRKTDCSANNGKLKNTPSKESYLYFRAPQIICS